MTGTIARPAPGPPRPYAFPDYTRERLASGLTILVAPVRRLPVCALSLVIDAGAELDPAGEEGLALLTARGLAEGTAQFPGIAFTERVERIGASLEASADWDSAHLSLAVVAERLPQALELLASVVTEPAFPEAELSRLRDERLAEIVQIRAEPRGLANEFFSRVVYAAQSRYSQPLGGNERSVSAMDRAALLRHHATFHVPDRTTVIVVGDVNGEDVHRLVERTFSTWSSVGSAPSPRRGVESESRAPISVVHRATAPQSELRVGHMGVARATPDYFPLVLMNAVLGGLFSSRINLNLREEHGYTYGAHSGFDWRRGKGPFTIMTAVESGVTGGAVAEILKEVRRIREAPVTDAELSLARDYMSGVFPIRFETSFAIAGALAQLVTHDLPADYYDTYRANIEHVTAADILRVARENLDPARMAVVTVGDADVTAPQLESLELGGVAVLSADDAFAAGSVSAAQPPG